MILGAAVWGGIVGGGGLLMMGNSVYNMVASAGTNGPDTVSVPAQLAVQAMDPIISDKLQKAQKQLDVLKQQDLVLLDKQNSVEKKLLAKQNMEQFLSKNRLYIISGGILLTTVMVYSAMNKKTATTTKPAVKVEA